MEPNFEYKPVDYGFMALRRYTNCYGNAAAAALLVQTWRTAPRMRVKPHARKVDALRWMTHSAIAVEDVDERATWVWRLARLQVSAITFAASY